MTTVVGLAPVANLTQYFENSGIQANGCKIFAYQAGSFSILQNTYTDHTGSTPNTNPIVFDSNGRTPATWLDMTLSYNLVLTLPDGITVLANLDNVTGVPQLAFFSSLTATNADNVKLTSSTLNASLPILFAPDALGGYKGPLFNSNLEYNPSTKSLTLTAGSVTAPTFVGSLTGNADTASNGFVAGMVSDFAGTSVPTGWLLCDGSAVSRTTYAALFTAIGTTWGIGDGATTFNVPDLRRRVTVGSGGSGASRSGFQEVIVTNTPSGSTAAGLGGGGSDYSFTISKDGLTAGNYNVNILSSDSFNVIASKMLAVVTGAGITVAYTNGAFVITSNTTGFTSTILITRPTTGANPDLFDSLATAIGYAVATDTPSDGYGLGTSIGSTGGTEIHTLSVGELPSHSHSTSGIPFSTSPQSGSATPCFNAATHTVASANAGGGAAHNIMQPSAVVQKIIKT